MHTKLTDVPTRGEATRSSIEDAAVELFTEQGYHATSMRQIADRAGLALGGIYNHFSGKEEIFQAIIVDKHPYRRILPLVVEAEGRTTEDFLRSAFRITVSELEKEPIYIKIMLIEMVEFNGRHGAGILKEIAPTLLPVFEKALKSRRDLRITNPALFLRSFFGMIISYFITGMLMQNSILNKLMPRDATGIFLDSYLHGVLKEAA